MSLDISDDSLAIIQRELEVEERIMQAARRMAELPTSNRRERQKRKQSLQQLVMFIMCEEVVYNIFVLFLEHNLDFLV